MQVFYSFYLYDLHCVLWAWIYVLLLVSFILNYQKNFLNFFTTREIHFFQLGLLSKQVPSSCVSARFVFCVCYCNWVGIITRGCINGLLLELKNFAKRFLWFCVDFSCGTTWGIKLHEGFLYANCGKYFFKT